MPSITLPPPAAPPPWEPDDSLPETLPFEDNENMDSPWHRFQMELLINVLETNWKGRRFYCGGNMFIHFSPAQVRNRDFRGPDFFVVREVDHDKPRLYWAIWDEGGRFPDMIVELLSPTTADEDRTTKKEIYEKTFRTREYFWYDPNGDKLEGWRLDGNYRPIPVEAGRLWSEELEMWLGRWVGEWDGHQARWLRFFDRNGKLLPTGEEKQAARADAADERAKAALDDAKAEAERAKAADERAKAALEDANAADERAKAALEDANAADERAKAALDDANAADERAKAALEDANAADERAKAALDDAKAEAERAKAADERAKAALDDAKAEAERAKAALDNAKAEAERANLAEKELALLRKELDALRQQQTKQNP